MQVLVGTPSGCIRGDLCMYFHENGSKGKNIKNSDVQKRAEAPKDKDPIKHTHDMEEQIDDTINDKDTEEHID